MNPQKLKFPSFVKFELGFLFAEQSFLALASNIIPCPSGVVVVVIVLQKTFDTIKNRRKCEK